MIEMKDVLEKVNQANFKLEFMAMMIMSGRDKKATEAFNAAREILVTLKETIEGGLSNATSE